MKNKFIPFIFLIGLVFIFFWQFFLKGLLPIPADDIVGIYHPYRDLYAGAYPRGIPYKNFLITDPVRQQYPWKNLVINLEKNGKIPLWDPYEMAGKPLLANFQSGSFYPLNIIFILKPFYISWSVYIILGTFLLFFFLYLYLRNLRFSKGSSFFGSLIFSFSGFSIAWLEWGNITHTVLWLPLILLSVDKLFENKSLKWVGFFVFSLLASLFAGHLQLFFYVFIFSLFYVLFRWVENGYEKRKIIILLGSILIFIILTSFQWLPTLRYILESARSVDQSWQKLGWFIPWQNLIQYVAPDFFGNPATLNYWGVFNYGEFVGYIGVFPLILALSSLFFVRDKRVFFFGSALFISLILSYPTFFAKIPYILNIPLISTSQPTRLIFISDFCLAILSAFGLEYLIKIKRSMLYVLGVIAIIYLGLWIFVFKTLPGFLITSENLSVVKNNLILPTLLFLISGIILCANLFFRRISKSVLILAIILISVFDLFRFGWKFIPFTSREYLYPDTSAISFLLSNAGNYRVMSADPRIFPPNFSTIYKIQTIDGYDPLYLKDYASLIVALERDSTNINPPFGFDRIITPHNFKSDLVDLLGVKYVLSLSDLSSLKLNKVFQEGETRIYENKKVLPRTFFVEDTISAYGVQDTIEKIFTNKNSLDKVAIVAGISSKWSKGMAVIKKYSENEIVIQTTNKGDGFLILTDSFYPTWHVKIDGKESKIEKADLNFRGIVVPSGSHSIEFYITLL